MYQAIFYDKNNKEYYIKDDEKGIIQETYYPSFHILDSNGDILTLEGGYCRKIDKVKDYKDPLLLEKDVDKYTRYLVDKYFESDETPKFHRIGYFDIETELGGALTEEYIRSAPVKITAISLSDFNNNKKYCWVLNNNPIKINTDQVEIISCPNEKFLLESFLDQWEKCDFTIISGWNSVFFDIPYLYFRITSVLSNSDALRLSPINKIEVNPITNEINIGCLNHLDYMLLFKKFITKQEDSYKLGDIGEKYVNLGKIEYDGNLDSLYKEDINKFIEYNIRDVDIIIALENKLKFIELTVIICHLCHVPYNQIYLSTVLNDGAILTYLKRKGIVSPNKPTTINPKIKEVEIGDIVKVGKSVAGELVEIEDKIGFIKYKSGIIKSFPLSIIRKVEEYAGGYLKEPIPGLYEWVIDLDFTSLYPSIIRSLNIGLETLVGRIVNYNKYDNKWTLKDLKLLDPNKEIKIQMITSTREIKESISTVGKIIKFIENNNLIIAANGSIFEVGKSSVVCEVLTDWFNKRKEYNNLKKKYGNEGNKELEDFYDKRQHAFKIKLNDVYGSYAINGWRYTDGFKFISSAITLTGQRVTQESIIFVNKWMNEQLGTEDKDYIITSDTDSLFIHVKDLALKRNPELINLPKESWVPIILEIAKEIQDKANENLDSIVYEMFNNVDREHYFQLKQEVILDRGYFSGKRRYAIHIINKEGIPKDELDIKGMDLMKSNMPKTYRQFGKGILLDVLFGVDKKEIDKKIIDFKTSLKNRDWIEIAKPTGLKKLDEYIAKKPGPGEIFSKLEKKCPINTKASIYYNDFIRFKKLDKKYPCLIEGDKIKFVSLNKNPYNIDVIAFTGKDPDEIIDLINTYANREEVWDSVLKNKLENLYGDIKWTFPSFNTKINKFFKI